MKVAVTGANGHIGIQLLRRMAVEIPDAELLGLVRSERAADLLRGACPGADVQIVDYRDASSIGKAARGCDVVVHLVGIIRESRQNSFEMAHEDACRALVAAGLPVRQFVTLGILGSDPNSLNACFRSRAAAEDILLESAVPTRVIRVPMVLGPDDYASKSLAGNGLSKIAFTFRSASREQPVDSEDVVGALISAVRSQPGNGVLELAGPCSLSRGDLIRKAGRVLGGSPVVVSLPLGLGYLIAGLLELVSANPPVTRAMLGVLDHDDDIDVTSACRELDIELHDLDDTLSRILPTLV